MHTNAVGTVGEETRHTFTAEKDLRDPPAHTFPRMKKAMALKCYGLLKGSSKWRKETSAFKPLSNGL